MFVFTWQIKYNFDFKTKNILKYHLQGWYLRKRFVLFVQHAKEMLRVQCNRQFYNFKYLKFAVEVGILRYNDHSWHIIILIFYFIIVT